MPLLYFTQNLVGESLPDWTGPKLDFDPPGIGLKDDLPNRVAKGGLFLLGSEPLLFNARRLQHGGLNLVRAHQHAFARVTAAGGRSAAIVPVNDGASPNRVGAQKSATGATANQTPQWPRHQGLGAPRFPRAPESEKVLHLMINGPLDQALVTAITKPISVGPSRRRRNL